MIRHTSASLLIQEKCRSEVQTDATGCPYGPAYDPGSVDVVYLTHTAEGPMPGHISRIKALPVR
jgi:hypothetical protein